MNYIYTYKKIKLAALLAGTLAFLYSCKKESFSSWPASMEFRLSSDTAIAGKTTGLNIEAMNANGWANLTISEKVNGRLVRIYVDSTFKQGEKEISFALPYKVADNLKSGEVLELECAMTDTKGHTITQNGKLLISGTRPELHVNASKAVAEPGEEIKLFVYINAKESVLKRLKISEGDTPGVLPHMDSTLQAGQNELYMTYTYRMPTGLMQGDTRTFHFEGVNEKGISARVSQTIAVN